MAQPIAPEVWNRAVKEKDANLLPNKKTRELFKGNGGIQINPEGGICHLWDFVIPDYITDYDDRRINGLSGVNVEGRDGWGASAFGVFQTVMFDHQAFGMSRHRSLAFRLFDEYQYSGAIGEWGTATTSNYESGGQQLLAVAQQINEVKSRVDEEIIGPDMDAYNMCVACNGKIAGRIVPKPGYVDQIFDGDCEHFDWVAEPGPVGGTALAPRFAPIQCMELDFENIFPALQNLRNAWAAVNIDFRKCIICIDPDYSLKLQQTLTGQGIPVLQETLKMMQDGTGDGFKLNGFQFDFTVDPQYYPSVYTDANLNVVHSADGTAAFDKWINSITPEATDKNPFRTRLIASYRMGVMNFIKRVWNNTTKEFEKHVTNYSLGKATSSDYYGEAYEVPFENFNKYHDYPNGDPGAGRGLPSADDVPVGWTGETATGPIAPITKRKVVGLALYPQAVALSQEYSGMYTDTGNTRGKFTEVCWDVKYECWVLPQYSLGVIPIVDIDDSIDVAIPVSAKVTNTVEVAGASATTPVFTKEVTAADSKKKVAKK